MKIFETEVRVRYQETDQMGVVYHANYLTWFEIGRTEFIRSIGVPYSHFEDHGILLPVIHVHLDYKLPALYDDLVIIKTRVSQFSGLRIYFSYEIIRKETNETLVMGETHHVWVNKDFRPVNLKKAWPEMYALVERMGN